MRKPPSPPRRSAGGVLTVVIVLLALAAAGGWWYRSRKGKDDVSYQTQKVERGSLTQVVTATGTLNPVINVQVGSQISGIIEKLFADYNTPVKAGQVVAQIDPATYQAVVMQAEGELANAQATLELARINEKRARELDARKAAPQSSLDQAVAALRQAQAQVQIRQGALQRAKVDFDRCTIYSPIDGIVISRSVDVGQTVAASLSAPVIFTIANDLAKMQINANVAEADVGNVEEGQAVDFTVDAYPSRTFHGKVTQVRNAPVTVQNVVSYDTIIEVHNEDLKLKPGMTANASIIIARRDEALKIGAAAFRFRPPESSAPKADEPRRQPGARGPGRRGGGKARQAAEKTVYVLKNGAPSPVRIKTGISDGISVEVLEGLNEGDEVVTGMSGGKTAAAARPSNPFMGGGMRRRF